MALNAQPVKSPSFTPTATSAVGFELAPLASAGAAVITTKKCGFAGRAPRDDGTLGRLQSAALKFCRDQVSRNKNPYFLEYGCGTGSFSVLLSQAGASVTAVDQEDNLCDEARKLCGQGRLTAVIKPAEQIYPNSLAKKMHGVVAEKFLHWLPHVRGQILLRNTSSTMVPGAKAFISVAGFDCPLANGYPMTKETPLKERYAAARDGRGKFGHPMTLYTFSEIESLLKMSGLEVLSSWTTDWGLHNFVAIRNPGGAHRGPVRTPRYG